MLAEKVGVDVPHTVSISAAIQSASFDDVAIDSPSDVLQLQSSDTLKVVIAPAEPVSTDAKMADVQPSSSSGPEPEPDGAGAGGFGSERKERRCKRASWTSSSGAGARSLLEARAASSHPQI